MSFIDETNIWKLFEKAGVPESDREATLSRVEQAVVLFEFAKQLALEALEEKLKGSDEKKSSDETLLVREAAHRAGEILIETLCEVWEEAAGRKFAPMSKAASKREAIEGTDDSRLFVESVVAQISDLELTSEALSILLLRARKKMDRKKKEES